MSSITATRTGRSTPPAPPSRTRAPSPTPKPSRGRRTADDLRSGASIGRSDRPVLRIVARNGSSCGPATSALVEPATSSLVEPAPSSLVEPASAASGVETTLRAVDLADFFVAEFDGDDVSVEIARPRRGSLRLTRRGRLAVLGLGLAASVGLGFAAAAASQADGRPEPTRVVVVQPGQTLWSIASGVAHGADVRAAMSHLEAINHLDTTTLQVGQRLRVPR